MLTIQLGAAVTILYYIFPPTHNHPDLRDPRSVEFSAYITAGALLSAILIVPLLLAARLRARLAEFPQTPDRVVHVSWRFGGGQFLPWHDKLGRP